MDVINFWDGLGDVVYHTERKPFPCSWNDGPWYAIGKSTAARCWPCQRHCPLIEVQWPWLWMTLPLVIGLIGCKVSSLWQHLAGNILNVCRRFWYVGQLALLIGGPRLGPQHNKVQGKQFLYESISLGNEVAAQVHHSQELLQGTTLYLYHRNSIICLRQEWNTPSFGSWLLLPQTGNQLG